MIYLALFAIVSVLGVIFAALMFAFKDILHSALALSGVFLINSLLFIALNQPLLAVIQLFIMIGGITTFIFVGVASATYSHFRYTKLAWLGILSAVFFIVLVIPLLNVQFNGQQSNVFGASNVGISLDSSVGLFYVMLFVMFGVSLGAILLLKKAGDSK
jgi:NADH-quinone oxidoreductase subunit J